MPDDVGVVEVPGHAEPVIYHLDELIRYESHEYHGGGTMRIPIGTGRYGLTAVRYLGRPTMPISEDIRAAVLADCARRGIVVEFSL